MLVRRIPAGSCRSLQLRVGKGTGLDPGEYPGSLVLIAPGAGVTRLSTIVEGPGKKPAQPQAVTEGDTASLHDVTVFDDNAATTLLLRGVAAGEAAVSIGKECADTLLPEHEHCEHLGNLYQGSRVVLVSVRGKAFEDQHKDVQELPIKLKYFGHPVGTYEGTLTLTDGKVSRSVKLKVDFKDAWFFAVLALLLGTLIALVPQLYEGRWRLKSGLEERRDRIEEEYWSARVQGFPSLRVDGGGLEKYLAGVDKAIRDYARSVVLLDTKSTAYGEIDKTLTLAEVDSRPLLLGGLGRSLTALQHEAKLTTDLLKQKEVSDLPQILLLAAEPLKGSIGIGEAAKRAKTADDLTAVIKSWRGLIDRVLFYAVWLKRVSGDPKTGAHKLTQADSQLIATAGAELFGVRQELFEEVTDAEGLARVRNSGRIERASTGIVQLATKLKVPMPPHDARPNEYAGLLKDVGYPSKQGPPMTDEDVDAKSTELEATPILPVDLPARKLRLVLFDALALTSAVAVSIIAGLSAFYFGKSFGTLEDYLTVIFAGTAAQVVAKAVLERLEVFVHDISPIARTKAAVVEAALPPA